MKTTRWVVGTDLSELSRLALLRAIGDAPLNERTELHIVLSIYEPPRRMGHPTDWDAILKKGHRELERFVNATRRGLLPDACLSCVLHVAIGEPVPSILSVSDEVRATQIFVGTHGRQGVSRTLLGSVAEAVVRRATCPVLVVRAVTHPPTIEAEPAGPDRAPALGEEPHVYRYTSVLAPETPPGHLL